MINACRKALVIVFVSNNKQEIVRISIVNMILASNTLKSRKRKIILKKSRKI